MFEPALSTHRVELASSAPASSRGATAGSPERAGLCPAGLTPATTALRIQKHRTTTGSDIGNQQSFQALKNTQRLLAFKTPATKMHQSD